MAYFEEGTIVSANDILIALGNFLAANGWSIDYNGVYNTSYRRLHVHKGAAHFDWYSNSATGLQVVGCTGYESGQTPANQPNPTSIKLYSIAVGGYYRFVSVPEGAYLCMYPSTSSIYYQWSFMGTVVDKIGSWEGGPFISKPFNGFLSSLAYASNNAYAQIFINGSWSGNGVAANGVAGNVSVSASGLSNRQPGSCNLGIVPFPVVVYLLDSADTSKFHPIGYLPSVFRTHVGDVYSAGDEIVIGSDTYLVLPMYMDSYTDTTYGHLLFKIGA